MTFKEEFVKIKPRETAGSTSSSRFDYQKDWSICQLIDKYNDNNDYIFLFDYHDDLIIIDSEASPSKISVYQIKGKSTGSWSLKNLIAAKTGKDGEILYSILGKLYYNKLAFKDLETESLNFVTNAPFSISLETGEKCGDNICVVEIKKEDKEKIHEQLKKEHGLADLDGDFEIISHLRVVDVNLKDSSTYTKGKLADFLNELNPKSKYNPVLIYNCLFEEVKRRTNYTKQIVDFNDLVENKGLSINTFKAILDQAGAVKDYQQIWQNVHQALIKEFNFSDCNKYQQIWTTLEIERMNPTNQLLQDVIKKVKKVVVELRDSNRLGNTLKESLENIASEVEVTLPQHYKALEKYYVETIILSELYG